MNPSKPLKPMPFWESVLLFGVASALFYLATRNLIPFLVASLSLPGIIGWFISGGLVFLLLFISSLFLLKRDGHLLNWRSIKSRFRLQRMGGQDWLWLLYSLLAIGLLNFLLIRFLDLVARWLPFLPAFTVRADFMRMSPLEPGQGWYLLAWLPMLFFNVFGEEFLWRGYILPRQEARHGSQAWIVNGTLWFIMHLPLGVSLAILSIPLMYVICYVAQRRKNNWLPIMIHGLSSISGMLMLFFGILKN